MRDGGCDGGESAYARRNDVSLDWPYGTPERVSDNDAEYVTPLDMLAELREDNGRVADRMRTRRGVCEEHGDVATASLLEVWIDEAER